MLSRAVNKNNQFESTLYERTMYTGQQSRLVNPAKSSKEGTRSTAYAKYGVALANNDWYTKHCVLHSSLEKKPVLTITVLVHARYANTV